MEPLYSGYHWSFGLYRGVALSQEVFWYHLCHKQSVPTTWAQFIQQELGLQGNSDRISQGLSLSLSLSLPPSLQGFHLISLYMEKSASNCC